MSGNPDYHSRRKPANEESRDHASHHAEPWLSWEEELLSLWKVGEEGDLSDLADLLGRTIEACRQRFYLITRIGYSRTTVRRTDEGHSQVTITTVVCTRCGLVHPGEC